MEVALLLRRLWRLRLLSAIGVPIATFVVLATLYDVRVDPPELVSKTSDFGAATAQFVVDTEESSLSNLAAETDALAARAEVFTTFAQSDQVRDEIARRLRTSPSAIAVATKPNTAQQANDPNASGPAPLAQGTGYSIQFQAQLEQPVVNVSVTASNGKRAVRAADAAVRGLSEYVQSLSAEGRIAASDRVVIRQVGPATGGQVTTKASVSRAVLAGVAAFTAWCVALLLLSGLRQEWRRATAEEVAPIRSEPDAESSPQPEDSDGIPSSRAARSPLSGTSSSDS